MVDFLVPYIRLPDHSDPLLEEFTYGDIDIRAKKLKDLSKGSFVFFHTSLRGHKCITAYYVIDRVLDTQEAVKNQLIMDKYKNPHLKRGPYKDKQDVLIFGDPILSKKLSRPLPFDKNLAKKLSLNIPFDSKHSDNACIVSATRQWRLLTDNDVKFLLEEIKRVEAEPISSDILLSTDEVSELREIDLEDFIARNPSCLGKGLVLNARAL